MKMPLFETLRLKFEQADWARNPEFGLLDTIIESHPELITIVSDDILKGSKNSILGRKDMPSVEQIFRQDTTVVETNIHYPTNNSLVWDCIKECHLLLSHLKEEIQGFDYRDYSKSAKKTFFKINNTKTGDKRVDLFKKQLVLLPNVLIRFPM